MLQVNQYGDEAVKNIIKLWLMKLADAIGDNITPSRLDVISEDLVETYHYDSLEDLRECLKNGRRGEYGFGHHKRGYITALLLRDWMKEHLDFKASLRENEHQKKKLDIADVENFDSKKFYEEGAKFFKQRAEREKKRNSFSTATYEELKHRYFEGKKSKEDKM